MSKVVEVTRNPPSRLLFLVWPRKKFFEEESATMWRKGHSSGVLVVDRAHPQQLLPLWGTTCMSLSSAQHRSYCALAPLPAVHAGSPTLSLLKTEAALMEDAHREHIPVDYQRLRRFIFASTSLKNLHFINKARSLVQRLRPTDGALQTALIDAYAEIDRPHDALAVFMGLQTGKEKKLREAASDPRAYGNLLKAFMNQPGKAREVINMIKDKSMQRHTLKFILFITHFPSLELKPNVFIFNMMIASQLKAGQLTEAENTFKYMKSRAVFPTAHTYTSFIDTYLKRGTLRTTLCWPTKKLISKIFQAIAKMRLSISTKCSVEASNPPP